MGKFAYAVYAVLLVLFSAVTFAEPFWKDVSPKTVEGEALFFSKGSSNIVTTNSLQLRIHSIDPAHENVVVTIIDGKGNIVAPQITLTKNAYQYISHGKVRARVADFRELRTVSGSKIPEVAFEIGVMVDAEILNVKFPERMDVGVLYQAEVEVRNLGQETEEMSIIAEVEKPYVKFNYNKRTYQVNPVATNQKMQFGISPQEAVTGGKVTLKIVFEGAVLDTYVMDDVTVVDDSSGYIDNFLFPKETYKSKKYLAQIRFTNNANTPSKMRLKFVSDAFQIDTKSKFGSDLLAELLDPHVTKTLELYITPIKTGKQTLQIELYSNERPVDKLLYDVQVNSYVLETEEPPLEEIAVESVSLEEETPGEVASETPARTEETTQTPLPTGEVVSETTESTQENDRSSFVRLLGVLVALLLCVGIYNRFVKEDKSEPAVPKNNKQLKKVPPKATSKEPAQKP